MRTRFWFRTIFPLVLLAAAAASAVAAPGLGARVPPAVPQETWEARQRMQNTIFAPLNEAAGTRQTILTQSEGSPRVWFQHDTQSDALYLIFANQEGTL